MNKTALITGASSGIGAELAKVFAGNKHNVILVARRLDKLEELKEELVKNEVSVETIKMDLAQPNAAKSLFDEVNKLGASIDFLVNNAGFGGQGAFHERSWEQESQMMQLNMVTLAQLCHLILPQMINRGSGKILNIASSAGLLPGGPYQSVYFATKAFVVSLTNGISKEIEGTGVSITALCPGPVETGFEKAANLEGTNLFAGKTFSPDKVALDGYNAMMSGKRQKTTALSFGNRIGLFFEPLTPATIGLSFIKKLQQRNE